MTAQHEPEPARHAPDALDAEAVARLSGAILPLRRALVRLARTDVRLPELPDSQVELLRALPPGAVRPPGELASELGLSRPAVSNLLKALEADGLITRHVAETNRRYVDVQASKRAVRRLARFDRASAKRLAEAARELSSGEREALVAALPALEHLRDAVRAVSAAQRAEH
ncbi:MarR family winged helix-turn-helix transcriptional regulator [Agromyces aerolatus]|uniref:MarR family winged helix-turn-helix transcriptional regulator n=1 Tax=Agromyces sp. LY-1074 TaxID=3074080 RepID=UPI002856A29A|nr:MULTISPECIES: MarR family transcriptional regulator [unclassified Agromyces]MDR5699171.1 MarR family transcriptional regulator [Agromyces sp. LY-1074]MDR5705466.1 MarR family transcriptional regulator [Agromyces sp. LY-1358]